MFRPQAKQQFLVPRDTVISRCALGRQRKGDAVRQPDVQLAGGILQPAGNEIHRGRADEACDKAGRRIVIEIVGRSDLFDAAMVHDHDPVGKRHRLNLIVGHINGRGADLLVHFFDLDPHLDPKLGVQVGQRFVKQKNLGVANDGATHRDALALAAGKLLGLAVDQLDDIEHARGFIDPRLDLGFWEAFQAKSERHVFRNRHVGV